MSDIIDTALTKRFQHIIDQEQWSFEPYSKKVPTAPSLQGGEKPTDKIFCAAVVLFVGCILAMAYMKLPCLQR